MVKAGLRVLRMGLENLREVPAFAGMTTAYSPKHPPVIPAKAGTSADYCDIPILGKFSGGPRFRGDDKAGPVTTSGAPPHPSIFSALMNACCGISTFPNWRIFFFPFFCLSSNLRLRVTSPP